jgi:hypothetical protein
VAVEKNQYIPQIRVPQDFWKPNEAISLDDVNVGEVTKRLACTLSERLVELDRIHALEHTCAPACGHSKIGTDLNEVAGICALGGRSQELELGDGVPVLKSESGRW